MAETTTNGERPREDPEKTLWMGDLAFEWDEAFIADLFEGFGAVTAYRPYDPRADRPTLYAFVTFESEAEATRAFEELNGATIRTRAPRPSRADRRDRGPGDPGRGDPARDRDEPRRERPANGRPRPDQEEGEAYAALALLAAATGEVPPGVPVGKVLGDFTARFVAERPRQAESPEDTCWRRALELGGNGVVAALVDGVLVAASERVQHHHATLVPVLARSPFGFAVLRRTLAFVMQLSASIETPRLRLAAPRGFLATVDGDDDVRVDADYCARLDASVRQLVDLDAVIAAGRALRRAAAALAARRSRRSRPRTSPRRTATSPSAGAEGEAEGAASLARGSWTSNGADDGAADGAAAPPATLLAAGDRAAVHGLDCAGTLNAPRPTATACSGPRRAAQASLDAAASDAAAGPYVAPSLAVPRTPEYAVASASPLAPFDAIPRDALPHAAHVASILDAADPGK
ncbi:hypothetical protein JL720_14815 [Aureococcus anophagefferens]|nr:hypothetical protein JL720_14815 [Aureococcus anophagefferens]